MKYYTLLALFLVLGMSRSLAQTQDAEPKPAVPNYKAEYAALRSKEAKSNAIDPNSKLDAATKRQKLLGGAPASSLNARKTTPVSKMAAGAGKIPSDMSSTDAEKTRANRIVPKSPGELPGLEQERAGTLSAPPAPAVKTKTTSIPKH